MLAKTKNVRPTPVAQFEHRINRKIKHLLRVMATASTAAVEIVNDEGDKAIVASAIREGKQLLKQVSTARKAITTPLQEEVKSWIAKEKELVAPIEEAIQRADAIIQQPCLPAGRFNAQVAAQQQAVLDRIAEEERARLESEDSDTEVIQQQSEFKRQVAIAQHSTEGVRNVWACLPAGRRTRHRILRTYPVST